MVALFGFCALLIARLDQMQTRRVEGTVSTIDGDTLMLARERVRLLGIDAFERDQTCLRAGDAYACGEEARIALASMTAGHLVSCRGRTFDRYGRLLAACTAGGTDVNAAMVAAGWALAYGDYEAEERRARSAGRGAWAGTFDQPAAWRAARGGRVEERQDIIRLLLDLAQQVLWGRPAAN